METEGATEEEPRQKLKMVSPPDNASSATSEAKINQILQEDVKKQ